MKKIKIMAFPYDDASEMEDLLNQCYERHKLIPLHELKVEENVRVGLSFHRYVSTFLMARSTEVAAETGRGGATPLHMTGVVVMDYPGDDDDPPGWVAHAMLSDGTLTWPMGATSYSDKADADAEALRIRWRWGFGAEVSRS